MADEKIILAEIDIETDKATAEIIKLRGEVSKLKDEQKALSDAGKENTAEYIKNEAAIKANTKEIQQNQTILTKAAQAQLNVNGSIAQMRAQLSAVSVQWAQQAKAYGENSEEAKRLYKEKLQLTEAIKKEEMSTGDARRNVGNYKDALGQLPGVMGQVGGAMGNVGNAAKMLGSAFKIMLGPVGIAIALIASIIQYFKSSEEGQNKWAKAVAIFNVVFKNLGDIAAFVGGALINAITKPKEAWEKFKGFLDGFVQFFKDTFGNVIGGYIDIWVGGLQSAFANIGLAWQKFKGLFVENSEDIKESQAKVDAANKKVTDGIGRIKQGAINMKDAVVDAYNDIKDAVVDSYKENQREIERTIALENQKAALAKRERKEIVNDAKDEAKIAELRAKAAEKDKYNADERMKLLKQAIDIQNAMMNDDLDIARQKAAIHKEEMSMSNANKETLEEQARLEAEIFKIQQTNSEARRSFQKQLQSATKENIEDQIKLIDYELNVFKAANESKLKDIGKYQAYTEQIRTDELNRINDITNKELAILQTKFDNGLIEEIDYKNEKLSLETDYKNQEKEINKQFDEQLAADKKARLVTDLENEKIIKEENMFAIFELERQEMQMKYEEEILMAEKIGADKTLIEGKYTKMREDIAEAEFNAKLDLASGFTKNLATIFGEQTMLGKVAAIASTTIETYKAAQGAFASQMIPGDPSSLIRGYVAAGSAVATGIANVKKIMAVNPKGGNSTPSGSSGGGGSVGGGNRTISSTVGGGMIMRDMGDQTEVIAKGMSKALKDNPQRTAVVVDDVTAKQSDDMNRNRAAAI